MLHKLLYAFVVAFAAAASVGHLAAQEPDKKPIVSVTAQAKFGAVANAPECSTVTVAQGDPMSLTFVPAMPSSAASAQNASGPPSAFVAPYIVPLAPPIYLVNFLLLYFSNPESAANMPGYRVALPQEVYHCLFENPDGCPYADMAPYFAEQALARGGSHQLEGIYGYSPFELRPLSQ